MRGKAIIRTGRLVTAAGVITLLAAALAGPASASPGRRADVTWPASHFKTVNLHSAYKKALSQVTAPRIGGIVYARGHQAAASRHVGALGPRRATAASCAEPQCPLVYHGGAIQHHPKVYLLLWGPDWSTDSIHNLAAGFMEDFYTGLGQAPQDTWLTITYQYPDGVSSPVFGGQEFAGVTQDSSVPPSGVTQTQLSAEAEAYVKTFDITNVADSQIVVATQSGTCPAGFYAPGCAGGTGDYCAWHAISSNLGVPFINLPYLLDAGGACGENALGGRFDGFSIVGGHEYAETITDPGVGPGWWDPGDGSEIGDKCAWTGLAEVPLANATYAMQPLFSNRALASTGSGCVMSGPAQDTVMVTPPSQKGSVVAVPVRVQIQGTSSAGLPLSYTATGLPPGLAISSSGFIGGSATVAGSYAVQVRATDSAGVTGSVSFTWMVVRLPICGPLRLCSGRSRAAGHVAA